MIIVPGKMMAKTIMQSLKEARKQFSDTPKLAIVVVGEHGPSERFVARKMHAALELDITVEIYTLPNTSTTEDVVAEVRRIGALKSIDALIVQLPLPAHVDRARVLSAIPVEKDVDVLSPDARARFAHEESPILPPIVAAVQHILEAYTISALGREVLVLGHGLLVGAPLAQFMRQCGARVTVVDQPVRDLGELSRTAQIIICGTGVSALLRPEHVTDGAVIIDAGMHIVDGKLVGDAHPDVFLRSALMKNILVLSRARHNTKTHV
jgi:methylenetetrahydrofolate dehydrogenase (NADP+)/methenyltetrahydrofolate cyclohydrolase